MREILFRGEHVNNDEWIYGYYVPVCFGRFPCKPAIVPEPNGVWEPIAVKSETIGQYTGKTDKNGKKIFDGDCFKTCCTGLPGYTHVVSYYPEHFAFMEDVLRRTQFIICLIIHLLQ